MKKTTILFIHRLNDQFAASRIVALADLGHPERRVAGHDHRVDVFSGRVVGRMLEKVVMDLSVTLNNIVQSLRMDLIR